MRYTSISVNEPRRDPFRSLFLRIRATADTRCDNRPMLPITLFFVLLAALIGGVWFAVTEEDVTPQTKQSRLGAFTRAVRRVRRTRSSPQATIPSTEESKADDQRGAETSAIYIANSQHPPIPSSSAQKT